MKNTNWQTVMFAAIIFLLMGFGVSLWALYEHNTTLAVGGVILMATVCVSWWFWVMYIIRSMMRMTDNTLKNVAEIKTDIQHLKILLTEDK